MFERGCSWWALSNNAIRAGIRINVFFMQLLLEFGRINQMDTVQSKPPASGDDNHPCVRRQETHGSIRHDAEHISNAKL